MEVVAISGIIIAGFIFGVGLGYYLRKIWAIRRKDTIEARIEALINQAKAKQKQILLDTNDKALKMIEDAKQDTRIKEQEIVHSKKRLENREALFDQKILDIESKKQEILEKIDRVEKIKIEVKKIRDEQTKKLEKVARLTRKEAKKVLLVNVENDMKDDLVNRMRKLSYLASEEVEKEARKIIIGALERCASPSVAEMSTSVVDLPSDEMKGRIIGKEGRNIKAFELATGVEIIVDDTPQAITLSCFSPIRRQVAKIALEKLILDGRIQPTRIEEAIDNAKKELAIEIKKAGEDALYNLGITGIDPKLVQVLGRLKYRTSYGQNILHHSIEVANLSMLLADQLGADVSIAKKGGLFHDIGKAVDHEIEGVHTQIGYDILKKFKFSEEIAYICIGHHEDAPKTIESIIVKVADAISGARPGARKDTYEKYIQRLGELENIASDFQGVEKAFAIQAGREIRIFVIPDKINDYEQIKLAKEIAKKIEGELKYPGEIKVNVIREKRVIEYAR